MKKVMLLFVASLIVFNLQAVRNGKRVVLGSKGMHTGKPKSSRSPAKENVVIYQEDNVLHINVGLVGVPVMVALKDIEGNLLLRVEVVSTEQDIVVPDVASIVEVNCDEINLVGMLY